MSKICVIIPMFGKSEYTRKCLDLTFTNAGVPIDVLVVDDGSPEPFKDYLERVKILRLEENSGFTNAMNQGILWCGDRYDYILCLNNDTEPYPDFVKELLTVAEADPKAGIVASVRIHNKKQGDQNAELCGSDLIRGYQYFTSEEKLPKDPLECNWIPLCSGLIRMEMIRYIGLLDPRFRNHCSDSEYCIRAKMWKWKVILVPKSKVIHHLSVTTTANKVKVEDDQRLFLEKLAGLDFALLMKEMPLDGEAKTYGKLDFTVYKK